MGRCHRCAWVNKIRWLTLRNLLRLGRRSGRRQEFTHLREMCQQRWRYCRRAYAFQPSAYKEDADQSSHAE